MSNDGLSHTKVSGELDKDVYVYFFKHIYAGDRGIKQELIQKFYNALYAECRRQGILQEWNPANYKRIETIMSNLNFRPLHARKPTRPGRPADTPAVDQAQPVASGDVHRSAAGPRKKVTHTRDVAADPNSQTEV